MIRTGSRSFHAASYLLPKRVRTPAYALYAFCRVADDGVDEASGKAAALQRLRERLDKVYRGAPEDHPADRAFADVVLVYAIPRALPEALLEGLAWDAVGRQYDDLSELTAYSARVASAVGVMMALLMGVRDERALARACDLGVAMQLTNICRDVGEDAREGRLFLPRRWMVEEGIDPAAFLADPRLSGALSKVIARLLAEADRLYARSEAGITALPMGCRSAIFAARHIYAEIGHEVAKAGYDSVTRRAIVTKSRKKVLMFRAIAESVRRHDGLDMAVLPEVAFLVDAVRDAPVPDPFREPNVVDRLGRMVEMLAEFERRKQAGEMVLRDEASARIAGE